MPGSRRLRRFSGETAFAGSSRAATAPRTTSPSRCGSPRWRDPQGPEVVAVPSGLLARGAFAWRPGDVLLVVSSSGEFRDLVEAVDAGAPTPFAAVTASAGSTLGARAGARALVSVANQRAVTHTQAFCGAVVAALSVWARVTSDPGLRRLAPPSAGSARAHCRRRPGLGRRARTGRRRDGDRLRKRAGVGRRARGCTAAEGGRRHPRRGRRDPRGGDVGDDGAAARARLRSAFRPPPRIRCSRRRSRSAPDRGRRC